MSMKRDNEEVKKKWVTPNLVKINVDETAGGSSKHVEHKSSPGVGHGRIYVS